MRGTERKRGGNLAPRLEALEDRSLPSVTPLDGVTAAPALDEAEVRITLVDAEVGGEDEYTRCWDGGGAAEAFAVTEEDSLYPPEKEDYGDVDPALNDPTLVYCTFLPPEGEGEVPGEGDGTVYHTLFSPADGGAEILPVPAEGDIPIDSPLLFQTQVLPAVIPEVPTADPPRPGGDAAVLAALPDAGQAAAAPEAPEAGPEETMLLRELTDGTTGYRGPAVKKAVATDTGL